jgi:hypothetical protein
MQDGYAYGRWSGSPGCSGFSNKAPTGVFYGQWSGGGLYIVTEEADGDFNITTPLFTKHLPASSICWSNEYVEIFAETLDYGDPLGGFDANRFTFTQKQFQTSAGGAWQALPNQCNAQANASDPPFKCSVAGTTILEVWTEDAPGNKQVCSDRSRSWCRDLKRRGRGSGLVRRSDSQRPRNLQSKHFEERER